MVISKLIQMIAYVDNLMQIANVDKLFLFK